MIKSTGDVENLQDPPEVPADMSTKHFLSSDARDKMIQRIFTSSFDHLDHIYIRFG